MHLKVKEKWLLRVPNYFLNLFWERARNISNRLKKQFGLILHFSSSELWRSKNIFLICYFLICFWVLCGLCLRQRQTGPNHIDFLKGICIFFFGLPVWFLVAPGSPGMPDLPGPNYFLNLFGPIYFFNLLKLNSNKKDKSQKHIFYSVVF